MRTRNRRLARNLNAPLRLAACLLTALAVGAPARAQCPGLSRLEIGDQVQALATYDDGSGAVLVAGGFFTSAGGAPAQSVATFDGSSWSPLGSGLNGGVRVLLQHDDGSGPALFAGGFFTTAGGVPASHVAKWDGTSWSALGGGVSSIVESFAVFDDGSGPALYAGWGQGVMRWDGASWSQVGLTTNYVYALHAHDDGTGPQLYAGGAFKDIDGVAASRIARWDGSTWTPMGTGAIGKVRAFETWDDGTGAALYIAGDFSTIDGVPALRTARWDGISWSALNSGLNGEVNVLHTYDYGTGLHLYAGGQFLGSGSRPMRRIARWDGTGWSQLSPTTPGFEVYDLVAWDDGLGTDLYGGIAGGGLNPTHNMLVWGDAAAQNYCAAGTSAGGCEAVLSATGTPSATARSGFVVEATGVEAGRLGLFFFGTNGRQANPWGNGSSVRCVVPPTVRTSVRSVGGSPGSCDGNTDVDLNALWTAEPNKHPGAGSRVNLQFWYRDPQNTSNVSTSFSDALEFYLCP